MRVFAKVLGIILIICALVFGAWYGSKYYIEYLHRKSGVSDFIAEMDARKQAADAKNEYYKEHPEELKSNFDFASEEASDIKESIEDDLNSDSSERVRVADNDIVCHISMPSCHIDALVYQNEVEDYYLRRDASGLSTTHGEIYTNDYDCPCPIIYGHHMIDGTMFAGLDCAYIGAYVTLEDIGYLNDQVRTYEVTDIKTDISAYDVWDYLGDTEEGLVFITCSFGINDGRTVVICKEIKETAD